MDDTRPPDDELAAMLTRLRSRRGGRVPYVPQIDIADCGAACLTMVLAYHGKHVEPEHVRARVGSIRGTDALSLLHAAKQLGLSGHGIRLELSHLQQLPKGSILHWGLNHFVVFEKAERDTVDIVDPARGRRRLAIDVVDRKFTGIALVFEPAADFTPTADRRRRVWPHVAQLLSHRSAIARVLVASLGLRVLALALPMLTAAVVDRVLPRRDQSLLLVICVGLCFVVAFQLLANLIRSHLLLRLRTQLDRKMTHAFLTHLLQLPFAYFKRRRTGDLMMRVASNAQIRELLTSTLLSTVLDGALTLLYLGLLLLLSPLLGALTSAFAVLQVSLLLAVRRRYSELVTEDLESQGRVHNFVFQMLSGMETLKISGAEERALAHWESLYGGQLTVAVARGRLQAMLDALNGCLQAAAPLTLLAIGAWLVIRGHMQLGSMLAAIALATSFLTPLTTLVQSAFQLQMLGALVARHDDVMSAEVEQTPESRLPAPRLRGRIRLEDVSFRYSPADPYILHDVSLEIAPGETIAVVGRSGCGKSTLAALVLGLYRPTHGRVFYDEHDLATLDLREVRRQIGAVAQQPFIFAGTIRSYLTLSEPNAPLERVTAAARLACIHDDIRAMPMGYDTPLGDAGTTLSGGQRQRLALARALLNEPVVLVLDEATSALDTTTERHVVENLKTLNASRIVIAHRLSTVASADRVAVMENGRIVQVGPHRELLSQQGPFADLVADQQA